MMKNSFLIPACFRREYPGSAKNWGSGVGGPVLRWHYDPDGARIRDTGMVGLEDKRS
jgi:hypothetical protein